MVSKNTMKYALKMMMAAIASIGLLFVALNTAHAQRVDFIVDRHAVKAQLPEALHGTSYTLPRGAIIVAQSTGRVISPTQAVRAAMGSSPGGQALGVRYNASRGGYEVRIRVGGRLLKLFVNGRTGRVGR